MINNRKLLFMIIPLCGGVLHSPACLPSRPKIWGVKRRDKIPEKAVGCLPAPSCKSNGELIHARIWRRRQWMYRCIYTTQSKAMQRLQFHSYRVQAWMGTNAQQRVTLYIITQQTSAQLHVKTLIWCWIPPPTNSEIFFFFSKTHCFRLNREVKGMAVYSFSQTSDQQPFTRNTTFLIASESRASETSEMPRFFFLCVFD